MSDLWVIQARNDECPANLRDTGGCWDTNWHTIDETAFATWDIDAFAKAFERWDAMQPDKMEACIPALIALRRKWEEQNKVGIATFRLLNVVTGEVVPQEIFTT